MGTGAAGCGGVSLDRLEASQQAAVLATLVREARLLQFSLEIGDAESRVIGDRLQRALEQAMDADDSAAGADAQQAIEAALIGASAAGMRLTAVLDEALVEGAIGTIKMPVLTAVLAR